MATQGITRTPTDGAVKSPGSSYLGTHMYGIPKGLQGQEHHCPRTPSYNNYTATEFKGGVLSTVIFPGCLFLL